MLVELFKQRSVLIRRAKKETVVDVTFACCDTELLVESLKRRRLRHSIGHIKVTRHPSCRCRTTLTLNVCLLRQARLTEMNMIIDNTWQNVTTRGINRFVERCFGLLFGYFYNIAIFNNNVAIEHTAFIYNISSLNQYLHGCGTLVIGTAG